MNGMGDGVWTALTIGWQSVRCERANENNESVTTSAGWNQVKNIHFIFIFTLLSFASLSTEGVTTSAGLNQVKLKPWCILFFQFYKPLFLYKKIYNLTIPKKRDLMLKCEKRIN